MVHMLEILVLAIVGIVFFLSGVYGWKFPSMRWWIRQEKNREDLNSLMMIFYGIMSIIVAIGLLVEQF